MALTAKKVYAVLNSKIKAMEEKMKQPITYKGKVDTAVLLPLSPSIGDMYNISQSSTYGGASTNVVWNGTITVPSGTATCTSCGWCGQGSHGRSSGHKTGPRYAEVRHRRCRRWLDPDVTCTIVDRP